jgi:hypothetical protein
MKNNNMLIYSEILPISSASFMCFLVAYHSNEFWSSNMEQKVSISCKSADYSKIIIQASLSAVNWFHKNKALSETALTELHRKVTI